MKEISYKTFYCFCQLWWVLFNSFLIKIIIVIGRRREEVVRELFNFSGHLMGCVELTDCKTVSKCLIRNEERMADTECRMECKPQMVLTLLLCRGDQSPWPQGGIYRVRFFCQFLRNRDKWRKGSHWCYKIAEMGHFF